jgi:hypothetical protein
MENLSARYAFTGRHRLRWRITELVADREQVT